MDYNILHIPSHLSRFRNYPNTFFKKELNYFFIRKKKIKIKLNYFLANLI
jgi:hypothetical protein